MKKCFLLACLFVAMGGLYPDLACAQTGDNGDGTFSNPVIWADVPDPDVIRVGDDFYMVSTTMHLVPGAPVMHSKDLVNWEVISYLYDRLDGKPAYDLKRKYHVRARSVGDFFALPQRHVLCLFFSE